MGLIVGPNRVGQGPLQNRQGRLGTQLPAQTALPNHQLQPLHRQRAGTKECQAADAGEDPSRRAISFRGRQHRLRAERQFIFPGEDNRCPTPAHRGPDLGPTTGEHSGSPKTPGNGVRERFSKLLQSRLLRPWLMPGSEHRVGRSSPQVPRFLVPAFPRPCERTPSAICCVRTSIRKAAESPTSARHLRWSCSPP